mgnify:CR=1 FL=1
MTQAGRSASRRFLSGPTILAEIERVVAAHQSGRRDHGHRVTQQHQHRVGHGLARQAGAGGAKGDRQAKPRTGPQHTLHFALALDHHHQLWHQPVEARIAAPGQAAQGILDQSPWIDEGLELAQQLGMTALQRGGVRMGSCHIAMSIGVV